MNKNLKLLLSASMAALCAASVGLTADAYKLSSEVKDVTPALREASTVGVWTGGNPALANPRKDHRRRRSSDPESASGHSRFRSLYQPHHH